MVVVSELTSVFSCFPNFLFVLITISVCLYIASAYSSICFFFTAAKEATAKTYLRIVIGVNIVYVVLLLLGFSSSAGSSHYDGLLPYIGTKLGLLGMLLTWIQQGYAYKGIVDNAPSTMSTATKRSKDPVVGIHFYSLIATIATQILSLVYSQEWFYINIIGVLIVYALYQTFYGTTSDENTKKNTTRAAPADDNNQVDPKQKAKRERRAAKRRQKWT